MKEFGLTHERHYKKSARIVGDVLGKYHPHGDQAVYDALVRMAQDYSMRYPLVEGQGNFGSVDGDAPAAMRYTEVRMTQMAELLLQDIDKETVDFMPNFDDTLKEPVVLPAAFPNLLVNGASGIAVGMATNIPPHNLREVIKAVIKTINNPEISTEELINIIPGPDFPTGGLIIGTEGIRKAYMTGNGQIKIRARVNIETLKNGKEMLIVNEIPYQVNKIRLIQDIAKHIKDKKIEGISDLRDESDRDGIRIVLELKRGINPHVIMNQLFKMTSLETTFGINLLALDHFNPKVMDIKQIIEKYIEHREEIVKRRTIYDLDKAEKRAHILEGFLKALDNIDEIIKIIRGSKTVAQAQSRLIERFSFTKVQAEAILDMKLARLTGLEREKIQKEYEELQKTIAKLKEILKSKENILKEIAKELSEIEKKFGDDRKTEILPNAEEVNLEDLILEEDVVVTITHKGFIKRTPITAFRHQSRGGVGVNASTLKDDDFIKEMFVASTHDTIVFLTDKGRAYSLKVHEIMNASRTSRGQSIKLLLSLKEDENIEASVALRGKEEEKYMLIVTKKGIIKKLESNDLQKIRKTGIIAIGLSKGDSVVDAITTSGKDEIMIATVMGNALRVKESQIRPMGRSARGVTGIKLGKDDYVCGISKVFDKGDLLVVTEKGYGKRVSFKNFIAHNRGTKGQIYIKLSKRTGKAVGILSIKNKDAFVVITNRGMIIKLKASGVSRMGRTASGVKVVNIKEPDMVAGISKIIQ
ncbi:MAG: DNA gyrase subunit A, partial [Spirochaetes bacterium]